MARLDELFDIKNEIITRLINNQDICKALVYNQPDFLEQPAVESPHSLVYSHIYPYKVAPDIVDEAKTYINISFTQFKGINNMFKGGYVWIFIISHVDIMKTDYGMIRIDYLAHEIDKLLNQTLGIGIGKLEFDELGETIINNKFIGQYLRYRPVDFN